LSNIIKVNCKSKAILAKVQLLLSLYQSLWSIKFILGLTQLAQAMPAAGYAYAKLQYICITEVMNGQRGVMASLIVLKILLKYL
jgi:hypothetical protein